MHAIWLLFDQNDKKYLSEIISELSKKYESPIFTPHVTIYGLTNVEIKTLEKIVSDSIYEIPSFYIEKDTISFSDHFWKTLFVDFRPNSSMLKINNNLTKNLSKFNEYTFSPHTSLIYKNMIQTEKQELIKNISIKKSFKITSIGIQEFSEQIENWKIVQEYPLIS